MKRLLASKKLKAALVLAAMTTNMMATVAFGETVSNEVFFKIGEASYVANGVELEMDSAAVIHNSRTMVPMRYAAEAFGAEVNWDKETRTAVITHGEKEIRLPIDGNVIHIGEEHIEMDTKAVVIEGRTMLPLAYIAQALGLSTSWDAETKTVKISDEVVSVEEVEAEEVTEAEEVVEVEETETEEAAIEEAVVFSRVFEEESVQFAVDNNDGSQLIFLGLPKVEANFKYVIKEKSEAAPTEEELMSQDMTYSVKPERRTSLFLDQLEKGEYVAYILAFDIEGEEGSKDPVIEYGFKVEK